jgi:hypothetical protein
MGPVEAPVVTGQGSGLLWLFCPLPEQGRQAQAGPEPDIDTSRWTSRIIYAVMIQWADEACPTIAQHEEE